MHLINVKIGFGCNEKRCIYNCIIYSGRVATLTDGPVKMNCVTFSPDGEKLVAAGSRSNITLRQPSNLVGPLSQYLNSIGPGAFITMRVYHSASMISE